MHRRRWVPFSDKRKEHGRIRAQAWRTGRDNKKKGQQGGKALTRSALTSLPTPYNERKRERVLRRRWVSKIYYEEDRLPVFFFLFIVPLFYYFLSSFLYLFPLFLLSLSASRLLAFLERGTGNFFPVKNLFFRLSQIVRLIWTNLLTQFSPLTFLGRLFALTSFPSPEHRTRSRFSRKVVHFSEGFSWFFCFLKTMER